MNDAHGLCLAGIFKMMRETLYYFCKNKTKQTTGLSFPATKVRRSVDLQPVFGILSNIQAVEHGWDVNVARYLGRSQWLGHPDRDQPQVSRHDPLFVTRQVAHRVEAYQGWPGNPRMTRRQKQKFFFYPFPIKCDLCELKVTPELFFCLFEKLTEPRVLRLDWTLTWRVTLDLKCNLYEIISLMLNYLLI